jgi:hypothetical protein
MQQTKVGTALSRVTDFVSGVIQGSVIGPLLFLSHASAEAQGNVVRAICLSKANLHF